VKKCLLLATVFAVVAQTNIFAGEGLSFPTQEKDRLNNKEGQQPICKWAKTFCQSALFVPALYSGNIGLYLLREEIYYQTGSLLEYIQYGDMKGVRSYLNFFGSAGKSLVIPSVITISCFYLAFKCAKDIWDRHTIGNKISSAIKAVRGSN
jgi:hypothetical protein